MIIGIMSDSHGDETAIIRAVKKLGAADLWIHAGDYYRDAQFLREVSHAEVVGVVGNCDGWVARDPEEEFFEIAGKKIWLCHGHRYHVKSSTRELMRAAIHHGADVVIYGHTHVPEISQTGNLLVLNPGSVARPSRPAPTCMRLEIEENGDIRANLLEIPIHD